MISIRGHSLTRSCWRFNLSNQSENSTLNPSLVICHAEEAEPQSELMIGKSNYADTDLRTSGTLISTNQR